MYFGNLRIGFFREISYNAIMQEKSEQSVLGSDPGTRITGFGVVFLTRQKIEVIDYGCIRLPTKERLSYRYFLLFNAFQKLIAKHQPNEVAVEAQYLERNFATTAKLSGVKAALGIATETAGIALHEYSATKAKKAVTGSGLASKLQVQRTLQTLLQLKELPQPEDASDALSLAYCHANALLFQARCMNI